MSTNLRNAMSAYGRDRLAHEVEAASPHKLVCMLYDGTLTCISRAKVLMQQGQIPEKGLAISHAISIIETGLLPSLDVERSGELGPNLAALYQYMMRRLLEANLRNDEAALDEVYDLLAQIKTAWEAIGAAKPALAPQVEPANEAAMPVARRPLSYGRA